jgi:hypothetical protein
LEDCQPEDVWGDLEEDEVASENVKYKRAWQVVNAYLIRQVIATRY